MQMILEGPCYRENCGGTMKYVDGIYVCSWCGIASMPEPYDKWLNEGAKYNDSDDDDYEGVPGYEELYDEDGDYIYCPNCVDALAPLKLHDGEVVCPRCGRVYTLDEFGAML